MNDRYDNNRYGSDNGYRQDQDYQRQPEQFQDDTGGQYGEGGNYGSRSPDYRDDSYDSQFDERGYGRGDPFYGNSGDNRSMNRYSQGGRDNDRQGNMSRQRYDNDSQRYNDGGMRDRGFSQRSDNRGYSSSMNYGSGQQGYNDDYSRGTGYRGDGYRDNSDFNRRDGNRGYDNQRGYRDNDRGFFDKAGDEIASWFGDDQAERRRVRDQRGNGPANYKRSNERLLEDACERLTHDNHVDARKINVTAEDNEITLDGTVSSRSQKRAAEDCVHDLSGVKHVQNNLRVSNRDEYAQDWDDDNDTTTGKTGTTTGTRTTSKTS
ncbi:BON domain-containing protein [Erythrobacter sp.]|uniref:BON domain-containing protein n=1 Tax=Erythrobacter sp. TaxID=1042 RepID=UPI003C70F3A6